MTIFDDTRDHPRPSNQGAGPSARRQRARGAQRLPAPGEGAADFFGWEMDGKMWENAGTMWENGWKNVGNCWENDLEEYDT